MDGLVVQRFGSFGRYARSRPEKFASLRDSLISARMDIHYSAYVRDAILTGLATTISAFILLLLIPSVPVLSFLNILKFFENTPFHLIMYPLVPLLLGYVVYNIYILYPRFIANSRKTKIDVVLPHTASFCYGMSKGGIPPLSIFKEISKNPHIYGEASKEFLYIVKDVELLGKDLISAMKHVARTTPSETFREFLENLVPMVESGSNIHQYFSVKMNQYFEKSMKAQDMFIKTLEIICEVYVVAFVAVPIFLLVTLVTIGLIGMPQAPYIFQSLFIGLPAGSIALIIIIDMISPKEDLGMRYVEKVILRRSSTIGDEYLDDAEYDLRKGEFKQKKLRGKIVNLLKNPLAPIHREPLRALIFGVPLMFIPFVLLDQGFDKQLMVSAILLLAPVSLAFEYKMRKLARLDRSIPDFLRRLAEINEVGLTLQRAIGMLLKSDIGRLSGEVKRVWLDLEWGGEMKDVLTRFENRIGTPSLRRAVTLIVKASEVSDDTRDVLLIAAEDAENMLSLRKQRFETGFVYMSTVYIAFLTFIYVCYSFSVQFLPSMSQLGTESLTNVVQINSTMFATCGILGLFSGIITGQMAEGRLLFGLKHAVVFLLVTYLSFTMFM
ncbi:MAG: type II secretion system F family protein, partial [Methanosarcinaceae archaeon]|nr:type II secretion system F family protein [Methanosarcinaceae archaeon]